MVAGARAVGEVTSPDYGLLRGGSDLLDLAMLAARSSAAARRVVHGGALDDDDQQALAAVVRFLEESAQTVEFFQTHGRTGSRPSGEFAARIDLALDAVLNTSAEAVDSKELAKTIEYYARLVRELLATPTPENAATLVDFFADLAATILRVTGHVGESTSVL